jgi:methionyl-tRNA formyltransferase
LARSADWSVAAVVTLPTALAARHSDFVDLADHAAAAGAPLLAAADGNAPDIVDAVSALSPDVGFVIGWSQLCRPPLVAACGGGLVGYHPAALPRLRGRGVIPWTILLQEPITAGSLFWVDAGVDAGPLIAQRYFHVAPDETATTLYARHMGALDEMLDEALPALAAGTAPRREQDERHATWAAKRIPGDGEIDWSAPASTVDRLIRAVTRPYPGASTASRDGPITIWEAAPWPDAARYHAMPGQVIARDDRGFAVSCGDGAIFVTDHAGPLPRLHARLGVSR